MKKGVRDDGELLRVHEVNLVDHNLMTICLLEGRKNHIRRIFSQLRLTVKDLYRYGIGHLVQGDLNLSEQKHTAINPESVSQGPFPSFAISRAEQQLILKKLEKRNRFKHKKDQAGAAKGDYRTKPSAKKVVTSSIISGSGKRIIKSEIAAPQSRRAKKTVPSRKTPSGRAPQTPKATNAAKPVKRGERQRPNKGGKNR